MVIKSQGARKLRDAYDIKKGAPVYMREFGYYCLDRWISEGHITCRQDLDKYCGFDEPGMISLGGMGGTTAPFYPQFDEEVLEDRGAHELVRDQAGRHVLYFKNRRDGFMPEYVGHPVKDIKTWVDNCKWRMDPSTPQRMADIAETIEKTIPPYSDGLMTSQYVVGGYMYLRSLIGPVDLMLKFYDEPELIHDCMETWLKLADFVLAEHQKRIDFDEILFDEDICYNHGSLISPGMIEEFLLPYYSQLIANCKRRQGDRGRRVHIYVATDGYCDPVIPLYRGVGMDVMGPFEVASNCDVVETGWTYPDLVILGGMDKRVLALNKDAIDKMVDSIMPAMKARGGYIPTCDHGVPEEVSFENYIHFRKRLQEYA